MDESSPEPGQPQSWDQWPLCPRCHARRQAVCESCQYAADDFPLAEYLESVEVLPIGRFEGEEYHDEEPRSAMQQILLMCPQCEEAFRPRFYRICHWCGFEFESGRHLENPLADPISPRVIWTIFGLVLLGVVSLLYFLWVTS